MHRRLLGMFATLVCLHAGGLAAQDAASVGQRLPNGQLAGNAPLSTGHALVPLDGDPLTSKQSTQSLAAVGQPPPALRLRGAKEVAIFRALANAVVLVVTKDGEGSGSLLSVTNGVGLVITNWHVVGDAEDVGIVFRPLQDDQKIAKADIVRARVIKVDPARDLALISVAPVPSHASTMPLGSMDEVQIGADVHAIGHPVVGNWSYTKGLVSQIQRDYQWQASADVKHRADVIQTQTPINPGNSGGPLIGDSGNMIGVNSFKFGGEGLNFAVSISEVQKFMVDAAKGAFDPKPVAARKEACKPKVLSNGRNEKNDASVHHYDFFCNGKATAVLTVPDDKSKSAELMLDSNSDGQIDAIIFDNDRDNKWDISYWDTDFDGKPDLIGYHPDGEMKPSRTEKYTPKPSP